ncbi:AraC family transcriptional regulator [Marinobacter sp. SS21]|uniref:AraC family transcriptional regulator n=1 Tax=Marinobacter sp. SS21 TaxID=2979460 RepID=UPI00232BDEC8|nr:AraC family transcriptional regulator [Marinobacter sp. SS21]MDC0661415.1 AraC family transcriptional regulator [Marinobacter sp. SS21]
MRGKVKGSYGHKLDVQQHSTLGLAALVKEMETQDVPAAALLEGTGLSLAMLNEPDTRISHQQKILIFKNMHQRMREPDSGLRAGQRQRISDFGIYGYALQSCSTFGQAVDFGIRHVRLMGPVFEKAFHVEGDEGVFCGRQLMELGELLPLATEFWLSSIQALVNFILEDRFPARSLRLPYPAPDYWHRYQEVFRCPVSFNCDVMEWRFDAEILNADCPNANPITAALTADLCRQLLANLPEESSLIEQIRLACLNHRGRFPAADVFAEQVGLSTRTLHRQLASENKTYQGVLDEIRCSLAKQFLDQPDLPVEVVSAQVGFSEAANFRKAFKRWTGLTPSEYRQSKRSG